MKTKKITTFNKTNLGNLKESLKEALAKVEQQHGIKFDIGTFSFSENNVKIKLSANTVDDSGDVYSIEAEDFKNNAKYVGLSAEDLGKEITVNRKTFKIIGLNLRAVKNPVMLEDIKTGQKARINAEFVKEQLRM